MKILGIIVGIIAVLVAGLFVFSKPEGQTGNSSQELTFAKVQADVQNGAKFYDVRTPEEFFQGHFDSAVNLSLQDMQSGALPEVSKDTKIYVHCRTGNRSAQAAALLRNAGFTNVTDLGGLSDVEAIGGKLTTS